MSEDLRAKVRTAIKPWFNYFAPGPEPQPSYPERIDGATRDAMAVLGYGAHRCVRCGQQQAKEDDTCPPCDLLTAIETIREQRAEIKRLRGWLDAKEAVIVEKRAERDRLRAAEQRVRELHSPDEYGDCKGCGLTRYEEAIPWAECDTIAALDQDGSGT